MLLRLLLHIFTSAHSSHLISSISFSQYPGKWEFPFSPQKTKNGVFKVNETTEIPVQMMTNKHFYRMYYDQELSATVLELPYTKRISMLLVLPDADLASLEKSVGPEHVAKWQRWMTNR